MGPGLLVPLGDCPPSGFDLSLFTVSVPHQIFSHANDVAEAATPTRQFSQEVLEGSRVIGCTKEELCRAQLRPFTSYLAWTTSRSSVSLLKVFRTFSLSSIHDSNSWQLL